MALTLTSTLADVDAELRRIDADAHVGKDEFKTLRDRADERLSAVGAIDASAFQAAADALVDAMRRLAVKARDDEGFKDRAGLREAMEYQIGYVVAGYQWAMQQV